MNQPRIKLMTGMVAAAWAFSCGSVFASIVYQQPPDGTGNVIASGWLPPNGTDADVYVYDRFQVAADQLITEIDWRGGYLVGSGGITDFTVDIYPTLPGGSQPLIGGLPNQDNPGYLARYVANGNAGETPAGVFGGHQLYDYHLTLSTPFAATGGTMYWVQIEGWGTPYWGLASATGGNGTHFAYYVGLSQFLIGPGDTAFTLQAAPEPASAGLMALGAWLLFKRTERRRRGIASPIEA